jgi:hypothetical protein
MNDLTKKREHPFGCNNTVDHIGFMILDAVVVKEWRYILLSCLVLERENLQFGL